MKSLIGSLDIGTSKVIALIARPRSGKNAEILGFGESSHFGIRNACVVDEASVEASVRTAIGAAEEKMLKRLSALKMYPSFGKKDVQWHLLADIRDDDENLHALIAIAERIITDFDLLSVKAASAMISTRISQRQEGVLVLDIGAGKTRYACFNNGKSCMMGVLPQAGDDLTGDLAKWMGIGARSSEKIKIKIGNAYPDMLRENETVRIIGFRDKKVLRFQRKDIAHILSLRLRAIFRNVRNHIAENAEQLPARVILTGGTSLLRGINRLAEDEFGVKATCISKFPAWVPKELALPQYSAVLGCLYLCRENIGQALGPFPLI